MFHSKGGIQPSKGEPLDYKNHKKLLLETFVTALVREISRDVHLMESYMRHNKPMHANWDMEKRMFDVKLPAVVSFVSL